MVGFVFSVSMANLHYNFIPLFQHKVIHSPLISLECPVARAKTQPGMVHVQVRAVHRVFLLANYFQGGRMGRSCYQIL